MTATATKITYTSTGGDLDEFHRRFEEALRGAKANAGERHPFHIDGKAVTSPREPIVDRSPIDTTLVLGIFDCAGPEHVDQAVRAARAAQRGWEALPWQQRVATMRRAAELIRERKYDLAAIMALEVGKNRLEAMGDVEESADLIDYYAQQVEDADGFIRTMAQVTPVERNTDVLRPYGVFACIAPFNFPVLLALHKVAPALAAGNAVILKPATATPLTALKLTEIFLEAGLPPALIEALEARGHPLRAEIDGYERAVFGRGQIILREPDGVLWGGSDPRADGAALGF